MLWVSLENAQHEGCSLLSRMYRGCNFSLPPGRLWGHNINQLLLRQKKPFVVVVEALALAQYHAKGCHSLRGIFPFPYRVGRSVGGARDFMSADWRRRSEYKEATLPGSAEQHYHHTATRLKFFASVERNVE